MIWKWAWDTTGEAQREPGFLKRGNGLWKVETFGIVARDEKTVHPRRRQKAKEPSVKTRFSRPLYLGVK
ncbi:MAG: hypothetical protein DYG86_00465 [Chloroflexi bacterium CFX2]|nr:hypothetical protein [Chloroflexi bacterium CFX2]